MSVDKKIILDYQKFKTIPSKDGKEIIKKINSLSEEEKKYIAVCKDPFVSSFENKLNFTRAEISNFTKFDSDLALKSFDNKIFHILLIVRVRIFGKRSGNDAPEQVEEKRTFPNSAKYILRWIVHRDRYDDVMASIEDRFAKDQKRFSPKQAKALVWKEVVFEIWPSMCDAIGRLTKAIKISRGG